MSWEIETLRTIRGNDPAVTSMDLCLYSNSSLEGNYPSELAAALNANQYINDLTLPLSDVLSNEEDIVDWKPLLNVIETRENLHSIKIRHDYNDIWIVLPCLDAIQRNSGIHTVRLEDLELDDGAIAAFLDAAPSLTTFGLEDCSMNNIAGAAAQPRQLMVAALKRHANIHTLELMKLGNAILLPILQHGIGESVKGLLYKLSDARLALAKRYLYHRPTPGERDKLQAIFFAIQRLFESTNTIQRFELIGNDSPYDTEFQPIFDGLLQSKSIVSVTLKCSLARLVQFKTNLQSLSLRDRYLSVPFWNDVKMGSLEHLSLGTFTTAEYFYPVINSVPTMRLKTLEVVLGIFEDDILQLKADLIRAVKMSSTLRFVVGKLDFSFDDNTDFSDLFNEADHQHLKAYALRNERRDHWILKPLTVPVKAWAHGVSSTFVTSTGPNSFFLIVRAIAPAVGLRLELPVYEGPAVTAFSLEPSLDNRSAKKRRDEPLPNDGLSIEFPVEAAQIQRDGGSHQNE